MMRLMLSLSACLALACASCGPCRECQDVPRHAAGPKQDGARGRPGRGPTAIKPITKVRIVRGLGKDHDGVGLWVVEPPGTDYRAVFGGTQGGVDPSTVVSDLYLYEGWVHVQGSFPEQRGGFRVPIVITGVVGIGADATEFVVRQDRVAVEKTTPAKGTVICLDGQVGISERSDYLAYKSSVPKDHYAEFWVESGAVMIGAPQPIPTDPTDPVRALVNEAQALASKF
jgi:hypothetical protein